MLFSVTATTLGAVACSHGWDSFDPRLGTASASGSGGGTTQSTSASESASSTTTSSASSGAGGADAGPPTYRDIVLADGPLAYWRLGDSHGPTIVDEVGGHPGSASTKGLTSGVPGLIAGNTAVTFDGHFGNIAVPGGWDFAGQSPFTFEVWVKLAPSTNSYPRILSKEAATGPREGYLLLSGDPGDGGSPYFGLERWSAGTDILAVYYHGPVSAAQWTHVVTRFDGGNGAVFINGQVAQSYGTDPDAGLHTNPSPLTIGSGTPTGDSFAGSLDELAIYGKGLSDTEIANHYTAGLAGL